VAGRSPLELGRTLELAVYGASDDRGHRAILAAGELDQLFPALLIDPGADEGAVSISTHYILAHLHAPQNLIRKSASSIAKRKKSNHGVLFGALAQPELPLPISRRISEPIGEPKTVSSADVELLAQQVSGINEKVADLERRIAEVERVNTRLEQAALNTARSMAEISRHWDAVYEAMRRVETETSERPDSGSS